MSNRPQQKEDQNVSLGSIIRSTLAAAIGVQSRSNRERDFEHGRPGLFIAAGIVFTALFVLVLVGVVYLVIGLATSP
ncbi:MAG: DUF2970 domain-containing protein [Gammaproteobacteria bacterium]|nr:MAG: DUF2970 domain-containing protein [Gammaproteobacteria bacterium]